MLSMKSIFTFFLLLMSLLSTVGCQANQTVCISIGPSSSCKNEGINYRTDQKVNTPSSQPKPSPENNRTSSYSTFTPQSAYLTGKSNGNQIDIYSEPSINSRSYHYGLIGDRVNVLDRVSTTDRLWYRVQFPVSGAIGWVQNEFVQIS